MRAGLAPLFLAGPPRAPPPPRGARPRGGARGGQGPRPWSQLVEPARALAAKGFLVDRQTALSLQRAAPLLAKFPDANRIFLRDGKPYQVGERLVQPELAATLGRIARN